MSELDPRDKVAILVVDDRPENILAMRGVLSRPEYEIIGASSGSEALKPLLRHDFAVILLDVLMPGMDGFETARMIRQREASRHIPIIFLTAAGHDLTMIYRGYEAGAVDYLIKPVEPHVVRAKVSVFVELYRKTQQLQRQEIRLREAEKQKSVLQLQESEAEYEATFAHAPSGIAQASTDGSWLRVNDRFCEILGMTQDQLKTQRLQDLVPAEEQPLVATAIRRLLKTGDPVHWNERRFIRGDGTVTWVSLSLALLRGGEGRPKKLIVVAEDIDARRREDEGRYLLAEAGKVLLSSFQVESTFPTALTLTVAAFAESATLLLNRPGMAPWLLHQDRHQPGASPSEAALQAVRAGLESGRSALSTDEGRSRLFVPLQAREQTLGGLLFRCSNGRRYGARELAVAEDLAQRMTFALENARLYEESQAAVRTRDEFMSVASHELRTPLTPLLLQLQSLQRGRSGGPSLIADQPDILRAVQRAERQVHRLTALVENLLDVTRIRSGQFKLRTQEFDLAELGREVMSRFAEELRRAGSISEIEAPGPVSGSWDRLRIEQVLTNLISNAIKYGEGKPIHLTIDTVQSHARLTVRDQGIGIALDKQTAIFERFGRAVPAESYGGLGLGLYISKQIVDAHQGSIGVDSSAGSGSSFTVLLPKAVQVSA